MTQEEKEKILGKIEKLQYYWCDEEITQCALNEIKEFIDSMSVNQQFYDTVTLWPRDGKNLPAITKAFDNETLYSQFVEDHWHDKDYMVEYNGNRHLFHQLKETQK